ncbi:MAG: NADH:flavin oxidoreductase [Magnetococcales bacterium]|nr:NADH:flavin oxidoreductase [Magnetococcales bacterium]NGZ25483.1 NADH:flavin oxidoreductase [Magnetococcales bacterium]
MATLFETTTINGMVLKNRIVRSATWEGMCDARGAPTEKLINCYTALARGEVGLIMSGYAYVRRDGKQLPGKMAMDEDGLAGEMQRMVRAVHEAGGVLAVQLVHGGGQTGSKSIGRPPLAPSAIKVDQYPDQPQELSLQDIQDLVLSFGQAARRAREWGFDGVQLHGAHGYLINQFLSPLTNQRSDDYGGSAENRRRFLMEVYRQVRQQVGRDYPVMIKLSGDDFLEGGLTEEESLQAAKWLSDNGIDALEISGGTPASGKRSPARTEIHHPEQEGYHVPLSRIVKPEVSCAVMTVGGIRSHTIAKQVIAEGWADYVSLSRPLIREPDLPRKWRSCESETAMCRSCNGCFAPGLKEGGIYCVVDKKERELADKRRGNPPPL